MSSYIITYLNTYIHKYTRKQASKQASKHASKQASKQANKQTSKHASKSCNADFYVSLNTMVESSWFKTDALAIVNSKSKHSESAHNNNNRG